MPNITSDKANAAHLASRRAIHIARIARRPRAPRRRRDGRGTAVVPSSGAIAAPLPLPDPRKNQRLIFAARRTLSSAASGELVMAERPERPSWRALVALAVGPMGASGEADSVHRRPRGGAGEDFWHAWVRGCVGVGVHPVLRCVVVDLP